MAKRYRKRKLWWEDVPGEGRKRLRIRCTHCHRYVTDMAHFETCPGRAELVAPPKR